MTKGIGAAVVAVQEIARWSGGWPIKEQHMTIPDDVEQWSLQFSNVPPAIMIWSAKAGHEPRNNSIALCQFDTVSDRNKQADQFRAIVAAHNQALLSLAGEVERKDVANALRAARLSTIPNVDELAEADSRRIAKKIVSDVGRAEVTFRFRSLADAHRFDEAFTAALNQEKATR